MIALTIVAAIGVGSLASTVVMSAEAASVSPPDAIIQKGDDGYRLGPGDKLHITVGGESDLTKDYEVDGSGEVSFPFVGQIQAAGLSARSFEAALKAKLDDGFF